MGSSGVNSLVVKISDNSDSYLSEKTFKAPVTMPEKQLELSKRNAFFKDPFFQDLRSGLDDGLEKRLAEFSARSLGLSGAGLGEAQHPGLGLQREIHDPAGAPRVLAGGL